MENQVRCDPQSDPSEIRPATMYAPDGSVSRVEIRVEYYDATVWVQGEWERLPDDEGGGYAPTSRAHAVTRQRFVIRWNGVEYQSYHTTNECDNRYPHLPQGQAQVLDASQAANRFAWGDGDNDAGFILSARNSKHYLVLADDVRAEGLNRFHVAVASRAAEQAEADQLAAHLEALAAAATSIRVIEEGGRHSYIVVLLGDVVLDRQRTSGSVWRELLDAQGQPNVPALKAWAKRAIARATFYMGEVDKSRIAKVLFEYPIKWS